MTSPAERRAERERMPVVNPITQELVMAAMGHPLIVTTEDGTEVLLRLATADEFLAMNASGIASLPEHCRPEPITPERAAELTRPLRPGDIR